MDTKLVISSGLGIVLAAVIIGSWRKIWQVFKKFSTWRKKRAKAYWRPKIAEEDNSYIELKKTPFLLRIGLQLPQSWQDRLKKNINRSK